MEKREATIANGKIYNNNKKSHQHNMGKNLYLREKR
jgi:hypothetical protein